MAENDEKTRILDEIAAAFAVPRPDWFCDASHCCECAEHEAELRRHDLDSLDFAAVGSAAWDPICFIKNPDGFKYFMPALARLACAGGDDYYLDLFCNQLRPDRIETFTERQRAAVEALIYQLSEVLGPQIEQYGDYPELEWSLRRLRGEPGPAII